MNPIAQEVLKTLTKWADEPTLEKLGTHLLGGKKVSNNADFQTAANLIEKYIEANEHFMDRSSIPALLEIEATLSSFKPSRDWSLWGKQLDLSPTLKKVHDLITKLEKEKLNPFPENVFLEITNFLPGNDFCKLEQVQGTVPQAKPNNEIRRKIREEELKKIWGPDRMIPYKLLMELNKRLELGEDIFLEVHEMFLHSSVVQHRFNELLEDDRWLARNMNSLWLFLRREIPNMVDLKHLNISGLSFDYMSGLSFDCHQYQEIANKLPNLKTLITKIKEPISLEDVNKILQVLASMKSLTTLKIESDMAKINESSIDLFTKSLKKSNLEYLIFERCWDFNEDCLMMLVNSPNLLKLKKIKLAFCKITTERAKEILKELKSPIQILGCLD